VTQRAAARGIGEHRLIYDPGIGFGKTAEQSLALITRAREIKQSGGRWLYGHSRKSFMKLFEVPPTTATLHPRDALTLQFSRALAEAGIDYLRVHDVAGHTAYFRGGDASES
jgi:dihydropteroate synthase